MVKLMILKPLAKFVSRVLGKSAGILSHYSKVTGQYSQRKNYTWFGVEQGQLAGCELFEDMNSIRGYQYCKGLYEQFLYDEVERLEISLKGKTVWDIGAHFGYHTLKFASLVSEQGQVFSFEPNPYNLERIGMHLARNNSLSQRIQVVPSAVSDSEGYEEFKYSNDGRGAELGYLVTSGMPSDRVSSERYKRFVQSSVAVTTVDKFISRWPNSVPNILKIDVEGAEFALLKGATTLLNDHHPCLLMEVHNIRAMHSILSFLFSYGYTTSLLDDPHASSSKAFIIAR